MLPRTCIILLCLSLLSAAATLGDRSTSVGGAGKPSPGKAADSIPGQQLRAAAKKARGKAKGQQGQGSRLPAQWPAGKRPSRRPQSVRPAYPRQVPPYRVCYLYPAGSPVYQDIGLNQPNFATNNGAANTPYGSYKISQPAGTRKRESGAAVNKMFGYPNSPYPLMMVCPLYQPINANTAVSQLSVSQPNPDDNDIYYWMGTDDPDMAVDDVDPGMPSQPGDEEEIPFPYDNTYGSPGRVPQNTFPSTAYGSPGRVPQNTYPNSAYGSPGRVPQNTYPNSAYGEPQVWYPSPYAYRPNF